MAFRKLTDNWRSKLLVVQHLLLPQTERGEVAGVFHLHLLETVGRRPLLHLVDQALPLLLPRLLGEGQPPHLLLPLLLLVSMCECISPGDIAVLQEVLLLLPHHLLEEVVVDALEAHPLHLPGRSLLVPPYLQSVMSVATCWPAYVQENSSRKCLQWMIAVVVPPRLQT